MTILFTAFKGVHNKGDNRLTIFECWIRSNNRRYPIECHIYLPIEKIFYCWNNLCENAKW